MTQDERGNKPSASGADRFMRCRPSFALTALLPKQKDKPSAKRGTKIHKALEHNNYDHLNKSDRDCAYRIANREAFLVDKYELHKPDHILKEERIWCEDLYSGKSDVIYVKGNFALVINYKTGHYDPTTITENWQMRTESVLAQHKYPEVDVVCAVLIHPFCSTEWQEIIFELHTIEKFREELKVKAQEAMNPFGKPVPGEVQCQFCRLREDCKEFKAWKK